MLLIPCPWCGPRDETEFTCGGEAHIVRPRQPQTLGDDAWASYLFMRKNPKGVHFERWNHSHGCRRWFNVARDTVSDAILAVYRMGEEPPRIAAEHVDAPERVPAAREPGLRVVSERPEGDDQQGRHGGGRRS